MANRKAEACPAEAGCWKGEESRETECWEKNEVKGWGNCQHCGSYRSNTSYNGRKWGHIYFIPLVPEGGRVRVIKECSSCNRGIHFPEKEVPVMIGLP